MSILAAMFETLFNFYCSVCLREGFPFFCSIVKFQKRKSFFQVGQPSKKFLNCLRKEAALYNLEIVVALLANTRTLLKLYCFESAQI